MFSYKAIGKKNSLFIGKKELGGTFKIAGERTLEDRLQKIDFISPIYEIPNPEMFRFWLGPKTNITKENPYLLIRLSIDPYHLDEESSDKEGYHKFVASQLLTSEWRNLCGIMTNKHIYYSKYFNLLKEAGFHF